MIDVGISSTWEVKIVMILYEKGDSKMEGGGLK